MTIEGFPTAALLKNGDILRAMIADYIHGVKSENDAKELLYQDLQLRLRNEGRNSEQYGIPLPRNQLSELDLYKRSMNPPRSARTLARLQQESPNNVKQEELFEFATQAIANKGKYDRPTLILVEGAGGTGKTTLMMKIHAYTNSIGKIVLGCASTAIAATIYEGLGFYTMHALFKLPVVEKTEKDLDDERPYSSQLSQHEGLDELMQEANVIIIDEVHSLDAKCIQAASDATNGFVGKVVICLGNIAQILNIADESTKSSVLQSCFLQSELCKKFQKFHLTQNMRVIAGQEDFVEMLRAISLGDYSDDVREHDEPTEIESGKNCRLYGIPKYTETDGIAKALSHLYPIGYDPDIASKSMILAVTNAHVDEWNAEVQKLNPNELHTFLSNDKFSDVEDTHGHLAKMLRCEMLAKFNKPHVPASDLKLKINDVCFLTKTISRSDGLVNNARIKIIGICRKRIIVETIGPKRKQFSVPRIIHHFRMQYGQTFEVERTQFPLRLAFATTYNRAQGQTLSKVLIDIRHPIFAHGFLYVALSRVRVALHVALYCRADQVEMCTERNVEYVVTTNVVYEEVIAEMNLRELFPPPIRPQINPNIPLHVQVDIRDDDGRLAHRSATHFRHGVATANSTQPAVSAQPSTQHIVQRNEQNQDARAQIGFVPLQALRHRMMSQTIGTNTSSADPQQAEQRRKRGRPKKDDSRQSKSVKKK
jgi:hypothetical protein